MFVRGFVSVTSQWEACYSWAQLTKASNKTTDRLVAEEYAHFTHQLLRWRSALPQVSTFALLSNNSNLETFFQNILSNVHRWSKSKSRKPQCLDCQILCPSGTWKICIPESDSRGFFSTVLRCYHRPCFVSPSGRQCLNINSTLQVI